MTCYREFPFIPDFVVDQTPEHKVNTSNYESGKEQVYWKGRYPRQWKLSFTKNYSDIHQVLRWWDNQHGPAIPFYWTYTDPLNNNRETILVRFIDSKPSLTTQGLLAGTMSLNIKEILT